MMMMMMDDGDDENDDEKEDWMPNINGDLYDGSKTFQRIGSPPEIVCHASMMNMMI